MIQQLGPQAGISHLSRTTQALYDIASWIYTCMYVISLYTYHQTACDLPFEYTCMHMIALWHSLYTIRLLVTFLYTISLHVVFPLYHQTPCGIPFIPSDSMWHSLWIYTCMYMISLYTIRILVVFPYTTRLHVVFPFYHHNPCGISFIPSDSIWHSLYTGRDSMWHSL